MATINGYYIQVVDEEVTQDMEVSSHPVETGIDITDTVKKKKTVISLSGNIVDYYGGNFNSLENEMVNISGGATMLRTFGDITIAGEAAVTGRVKYLASTILNKLKQFKDNGTLITYSGRNIYSNMQITSLSTTHPYTIAGGAKFTMTLEECRTAKNAYVEPVKNKSAVKNGGSQQVEKGEGADVYYTVKAGDCVWSLVVTGDYANLHREGAKNTPQGQCDWVMKKNPKAFSRPGDFGTLQIGKKILLGAKKT